MSIYSDKFVHVQVVINCRYSVAQMCTREDIHTCFFMCAVLNDAMRQSKLTTYIFKYFRFQEDSAEILKLREKEKGDWKKLTVAEKKVLYRASFCQTIAEVK